MNEKNYVLELIQKFADNEKAQVAFEIYDGNQVTRISYHTLADDILCAVRFFKENHITNTHIALIGANSYEWLVAFFAITASGNVAVLLNPSIPPELLLRQCKSADVTCVCGADQIAAALSGSFSCYSYADIVGNGVASFSDLVDPEQNTISVMLFTSGTTNESKVVALSYTNMYSSIYSADGVFSAPEIDKIMSVLPMFHISGLRGALAMLNRYKTLCIGRGAMYLFKDMPVFSPSYVLLVPMIVESIVKLLKHLPERETYRAYLGSNLRRICVGGASVDPLSCRYLMEKGFVIDGGYAMTETAGVGTWGEWDEKHFNTIGKLSNELQCRIEDGELLFRGSPVMAGYYKDPEATAAVIQDGWLHSGDLGYCDDDGYYYITGRKKNLIIMPNGEKINTEELETFFCSCDAILECRISSHNDAIHLEIVTKDRCKAKAFVDAYNDKMPLTFQIHKVAYFTSPLPRTSSGKIIRKEPML